MKKIIFTILLIVNQYSFSQDYEDVFVDQGVSQDFNLNIKKDITIPLYTIKTDGIKVPIYLTYDSSGFLVNDIPSSVGFNWKLKAGGTIDRTINHLVDESKFGWFFTEDMDLQTGFLGNSSYLVSNFDVSPDIFTLSMSNNDYIQYIYDKNKHPFIINQNGNFSKNYFIYTDFLKLKQNQSNTSVFAYDTYEDSNDFDIEIKNSSGIQYLFRKGLKRKNPFDLNKSSMSLNISSYNNYYIHQIKNVFNNKKISFEYENTFINKLIYHSEAYRIQTNSDPYTPPEPNDPRETRLFTPDLSIEDVSRKEIRKIVSEKEKVIFTYKEESYFNYYVPPRQAPETLLNEIVNQKIKLLDEIKIYNNEGKYITGYKFFYTEQTIEQTESEGDLKIKYIIKYAKNHKDYIIYRRFNYFYQNRPSAATKDRDVFGYFNNKQNGDCTIPVIDGSCSNRMPDVNSMISGMLKSVINQDGGKTEYDYIENSYGNMYYGGLLINKINKSDLDGTLISEKEFTYEDPEGFGLPIYDVWDPQDGGVPPNVYEFGFWENLNPDSRAWQTYFTKIDPTIQNYEEFADYKVKSIPFELLMNAPQTQLLFNSLELQNYPQIKSGSFYAKVTVKNINTESNQSEKGYKIYYYQPSISGFFLSKLLKKMEYYNNSDIKIKEENFKYQIINEGFINTYTFNNFHTINAYKFILENYPIFKMKNVLKNSEIYAYTNVGELLFHKKNEFIYLNEGLENVDFNKIKSSIQFFNDYESKKIINKYMTEYPYFSSNPNRQNYQYLVETINPVIEKSTWIKSDNNWNLISAKIKEYLPDNVRGKIKSIRQVTGNESTGKKYTETSYIPSYYDDLENLISLENNHILYMYNNNGEVIKETNIFTGVSTSYQRSNEYGGLYIDAILSTSNSQLMTVSNQPVFLRKSFENKNEDNVIKFSKAFSGHYVYNGNSISLGNFPIDYSISFWAYVNNKWKYFSSNHDGGNVVITKPAGALYIDEVRIQPKNSTMETFTFNPLVGKTSSLNHRGEGDRIEYDVFNRPLFLFDKNHKMLKEFRYNTIQN